MTETAPKTQTAPARKDQPLLAVGLMLAAMAFFAATTLIAKALGTGALGPEMHPMQVSHGRFLFALVVIALVVAIRRPVLTRPDAKLHLGRTTFGWLGVTLMFAAAALIPLSDATAISFLNPVFAMVFAIPLLGERVGPWRWMAAAIALAGAVILLRPGAGVIQAGALLALIAAVCIGFEITLIKLLSGRERPIQILLVNNTLGTLIATIAALFVWQTPTGPQWAALAAIGGLMACAQGCYVQAMARAEASYIAPFSYSALVFVVIYDAFVFGARPDATSFAGAGIIIAGALILAWRESRRVRT